MSPPLIIWKCQILLITPYNDGSTSPALNHFVWWIAPEHLQNLNSLYFENWSPLNIFKWFHITEIVWRGINFNPNSDNSTVMLALFLQIFIFHFWSLLPEPNKFYLWIHFMFCDTLWAVNCRILSFGDNPCLFHDVSFSLWKYTNNCILSVSCIS